MKPPGDIKNGTIEFKQITTILHLSDCSYLDFKNIEIFPGMIAFNNFSHYNTLDNIFFYMVAIILVLMVGLLFHLFIFMEVITR